MHYACCLKCVANHIEVHYRLLLVRVLYSESSAYYCGFYLGPVIPSSAIFVGLFACSGIDTRYKEPWFYVSFKGRGNRCKVPYPRTQARWPLAGIT
jgi:hypothetical protein